MKNAVDGGAAVDQQSAAAAGLSVTRAARRLGVAASTLRSWERRYGVAPSMRTAGGHRRYSSADLAALQRIRRLQVSGVPTADAARAGYLGDGSGPSRPRSAARFKDAAAALDASGALRRAERAITRFGPGAAWTEVFAPALREFGDRWPSDDTLIPAEHVASEAIQQALARFLRKRTAKSARIDVLGVTASAEQHLLPLYALAAALGPFGVTAAVLGSLPSAALRLTLDRLRPDVVVIWAQTSDTADPALIAAAAERTPTVLAAGPGWPTAQAALCGLTDAVVAVRAWV